MKDLEELLEAAKQHGLQSEPDHEVGDLRDILHYAWAQMDGEGQLAVLTAFQDMKQWL